VPLTGQITRPGEDSTGANARRGAAWMWPKEGWPAQHGARERREVSSVFGGKLPRGCTGGPGVPGGQKKTSKLAVDVIRSMSMCTPNGKWHPQRLPEALVRWLDFEFRGRCRSAAADGRVGVSRVARDVGRRAQAQGCTFLPKGRGLGPIKTVGLPACLLPAPLCFRVRQNAPGWVPVPACPSGCGLRS
jgi:hypothetical protein